MFKTIDREDRGSLRHYYGDGQKGKRRDEKCQTHPLFLQGQIWRYGRGNMGIASREAFPSAGDDRPLLSAYENGVYDALGASGGGLSIVFADRLCT